MNLLEAMRAKAREERLRSIRFWVRFCAVVIVVLMFLLALGGEFPELAVVIP